jgi:hypothetical protein
VSESIGGLQAAVFAGMAVTVLCKSALVHGMKQIGINEYFPPLPKIDLLLYRASGQSTPAATALHEYLAHYLGTLNAEGRATLESIALAGAVHHKGAAITDINGARRSSTAHETRPAA